MDMAGSDRRKRRRGLVAVIASMAVTSLIYGFSYPLLALVLARQGADGTVIGLNTAAQGLAVLAVAPLADRAMRRLDPARLMLGSITLSLAFFLMLPAFPGVAAWFVIRFLLGAANALLWIAGEAWVSALAEERSRGRVVGLYSAALAAGFALGPPALAVTGSAGWLPFLVAAAMIAASGAPLLLALGPAAARPLTPATGKQPSPPLRAFLRLAPAAMLANFTAAAAESALLTFLPLYGIDRGLGEAAALHLLAAMGIGGIACQLPIGWLADRLERRALLAAAALLLALASAAMPLAVALTPWNRLYMFLLGGLLGGLYTLGLVLIGERFRGAELAGATALFSAMWGIGSTAGLPLAGGAIDLLPAHGLPVALVLMFAAFLPLPLAELRRRHAGRDARTDRGGEGRETLRRGG